MAEPGQTAPVPPGTWQVVLNDGSGTVVAAANSETAVTPLAGGFFARTGIAVLVLNDTGTAIAGIGIAEQPTQATAAFAIAARVDPQDAKMYTFSFQNAAGQVQWDFGDTATGLSDPGETEIQHTYADQGSYRVIANDGATLEELYVSVGG